MNLSVQSAGSPLSRFDCLFVILSYCLSVLIRFFSSLVHLSSSLCTFVGSTALEVVLVLTEICLVHLEASADRVEWMDGMVIKGQLSSKSTFDANKYLYLQFFNVFL